MSQSERALSLKRLVCGVWLGVFLMAQLSGGLAALAAQTPPTIEVIDALPAPTRTPPGPITPPSSPASTPTAPTMSSPAAAPPAASEPPPSVQPAEGGDPSAAQAGALRGRAASDKAFAAKRREQANRWRERAENARRRAESSASPTDRESWRRDAEDYGRRAAQAEEDAAQAEARAAAAEREAAALRDGTALPPGAGTRPAGAPASRPPEVDENADRPPVKVEDMLGTWRQGDSDTPFVILPQDADFEAYKNRLEAHTGDRVWKGEFEPFEAGDIRRYNNARLTFTYTPTADEMNAEVPLWARQAVQGDLEWRIELDEAGTCGTPMLTGFWWPGEIRWRQAEGGRSGEAWVSGKGAAVRMSLSAANDLEIEPNPSPIVVIGLPDGPDPIDQPVRAVVKGQLFVPEVRIPPSLAEKAGGSVTVTLTGKQGGGSTELDLRQVGVDGRGWVVYAHGPVAIGDVWHDEALGGRVNPLPFSAPAIVKWFTGKTGRRLSLAVDNGETVEVKYDDVATSFTVHTSWVQRGIARFTVAREQLRLLYVSALGDPKLDRAQKESAHRRLMMIKNLTAMQDNERMHDYQKFRLAEFYLGRLVAPDWQGGAEVEGGLVNLSDEELLDPKRQRVAVGEQIFDADRGLSEAMSLGDRRRSGWFQGVVWTSLYELYGAEAAAKGARDETRAKAYREIPLALSYAAYDFVVNSSDVGDIHIILTGTDAFGKKTSRISGLAGLAMGKGAEYGLKRFVRRFEPKRLSSNEKWEIEKHKVLADKRVREAKSVPEAAKTRIRNIEQEPAKAKEKGRETSPASCAVPPGIETFEVDLGDSLMEAQIRAQRLKGVQEMYGDSVKVLEGAGPTLAPQQFGTCNLQATGFFVGQNTGKFNNEIRNLYDLTFNRAVDPRKLITTRSPETGQVVRKHMLNFGFYDEAAESLARLHGAEVVISTAKLKYARNLTLEDMGRLMDEGFNIKATIKTRGAGHQLHAVAVTDVVRNAQGEITDVRYFDPAFGATLELPACKFNTRMAAARDAGGVNKLQIFKWPDKARPTIQPPKKMTPPPQTPPTIEWAKGNPGDSAATAPMASVPDKSRPSYLPGLKKTLFDVLDEEYPDASTMPSFHFTDLESLKEMISEKRFRMSSGAQFSYPGGLGHYERGQVAIRIKKGHEQFVELTRSDEARGMIPHYWPQGIGVGRRNDSIIPAEHLQWLNPYRPKEKRWVDFDENE